MKTLFLTAALLFSPLAQAGQYVGNSPGGGCMWNEATGSCMIANDKDRPVICDIRIQVTTEKNQKTTKVNLVVIEAKSAYHSPQFRSPWDDKIEKAQIAARCK